MVQLLPRSISIATGRGLDTLIAPQVLIPEDVYNVEFFTESAINSASWSADCPGGTKLHYSPNTNETRTIAHGAWHRLACDAYTCDPGEGAGAGAAAHPPCMLMKDVRVGVGITWRGGG